MAATQPIYASDQLGDAEIVGLNLSLAKASGLLADSDVGGSNTYLTMQTAVATAAATKPTEFQGFVGRLQRALKLGFDMTILSDANVQGVTTIAELVAITPASATKVGGPIAIE